MLIAVQPHELEGAIRLALGAGSGIIFVAGPPGCGKSMTLARVLGEVAGAPGAASLRYAAPTASVRGQPRKRLRDGERRAVLSWCSAASATAEVPRTVFQRLIADLSPALALPSRSHAPSGAVVAAVLRQADVAALHLVVDDADGLTADDLAWLELLPSAAPAACVTVWVVAQSPAVGRRLRGWCRVIAVGPPSRRSVRELCGALDALAASIHPSVAAAIAHYSAARPMSSSVVAKDVRLLAARTCTAAFTPGATPAIPVTMGRRPNALQLARAWPAVVGDAPHAGVAAAVGPPVATHMPDSCALLLVALFVCGALSPANAAAALGGSEDGSHRVRRRKRPDGTGTISSSTHTFNARRLAFVYDGLQNMALAAGGHVDLPHSALALHHLPLLVSRGFATPTASTAQPAYACHLTYAEASQAAARFGIELGQLMPTSGI